MLCLNAFSFSNSDLNFYSSEYLFLGEVRLFFQLLVFLLALLIAYTSICEIEVSLKLSSLAEGYSLLDIESTSVLSIILLASIAIFLEAFP